MAVSGGVEVKAGGSFLSQSATDLSIGLGDHDAAEVLVRWPDGTLEPVGELPGGTVTLLRQGRGRIASAPLQARER